MLYINHGTLFAVKLDLATFKTKGAPVPVVDDVAPDVFKGLGMLDASLVPGGSGILAYRRGKIIETSKTLAWMDSTGQTRTLINGVAILTPRISPDGKLVAFSAAGDLLVYDLESGANTRLTTNTLMNNSPVWTPDGRHIIFDQDSGDESVIWWIRSDGTGQPHKLFSTVDGLRLNSISPDGAILGFARQDPVTGWDIWTLKLDMTDPDRPKPSQPEPFLREPNDQFAPTFSPDGRWIAYSVTEANSVTQTYVRAFPGDPSARKWQVTNDQGYFPVWSSTAKELFVLHRLNQVLRVKYTANGASFVSEKPEVWSPSPLHPRSGLYWNFDVSSDGKRIVTIPAPPNPSNETPTYHMTVLLNFFDGLKRRVP